jgi:hypothetical protein
MNFKKDLKNVNQKSGLTIVHSQGEKVSVNEKELQKQIVLKAFANRPKTMKMVEVETGIQRTNFTALLNAMYSRNAIYKTYFSRCPISKRNGVGFYTTNEDYKLKLNQLNLFTDVA